MVEARCGNCRFFLPEKNITISPDSPQALISSLQPPDRDLAGGSVQPYYGKCVAEFTNLEDGQFYRYDRGRMSNMTCDLDIGNGELAFDER